MKKLAFIVIATIPLLQQGFAQGFLIATRKGSDYDMVVTKKQIASVFATAISPYLDPNAKQNFSLEEFSIDDPEPSNSDMKAYCVLKATSTKETVTVGIHLFKEVDGNNITRLYLHKPGSDNGDAVTNKYAETAGWKCTSKATCGGCKRVRSNGQVVACSCVGGEGYCEFDVSGGGGSNWPDWITAIVNAILKFF